jgi:hypothetical protein
MGCGINIDQQHAAAHARMSTTIGNTYLPKWHGTNGMERLASTITTNMLPAAINRHRDQLPSTANVNPPATPAHGTIDTKHTSTLIRQHAAAHARMPQTP